MSNTRNLYNVLKQLATNQEDLLDLLKDLCVKVWGKDGDWLFEQEVMNGIESPENCCISSLKGIEIRYNQSEERRTQREAEQKAKG